MPNLGPRCCFVLWRPSCCDDSGLCSLWRPWESLSDVVNPRLPSPRKPLNRQRRRNRLLLASRSKSREQHSKCNETRGTAILCVVEIVRMFPRVLLVLSCLVTGMGCGHDPRQPDYIPQATIPLHPDPPVAAGGPPRTKAPAAQPKPHDAVPKAESEAKEQPGPDHKPEG